MLLFSLLLLAGADAGEADPFAVCRSKLREGASHFARAEPARTVFVLNLFAEHCGRGAPELARAAKRAALVSPTDRAEVLGASASDLPTECLEGSNQAPALEMSKRCPASLGLTASPEFLKALDAGTYRFALAIRAKLGPGPEIERMLRILLLSRSLER